MQRKLLKRTVFRDAALGYPVWRSVSPWNDLEYVAKKQTPDLIVVMAVEPVRMALAAQRTQIPVLMQLQDVEFHMLGGRFEDLGDNINCVANSRFTAERYRNAYGIHPRVIYPCISADRYRVKTTKENITFVNPKPIKGRDIAFAVARLCPDIPFTFVESWPLTHEERQLLTETLPALPNVTLLPPQNDMRSVYGKCKILFAPSMWEEGYGRVVTEAQISGIPVVASMRGGLPEAVGQGGMLLDADGPINDWVTAIRKLWLDDQCYADLSAAALVHVGRPEHSLSWKLGRWEQALMNACGVSAGTSKVLKIDPIDAKARNAQDQPLKNNLAWSEIRKTNI
jgi:glycosyltransferase involved in cell wall biosynthesis